MRLRVRIWEPEPMVASLHVVRGRRALEAALDELGVEVVAADPLELWLEADDELDAQPLVEQLLVELGLGDCSTVERD